MTPVVIPVEVAYPGQAILGEGPLWDDRARRLRWVDIVGCRLHEFDPVTGVDHSTQLSEPVTAVALTRSEHLILALGNRLASVAASGETPQDVNAFRVDSATVRFNDGKADPWGGFQVGTMHHGGTEAVGGLYRMAADLSMQERLTRLTCSNGLDWSDDRGVFFHVDSVRSQIDVYATDEGAGEMIGRRGALAVPGPGSPDGLTLDAEGCLWVAMWGGGEVRCLSPEGEVERVVRLPVSQVTSVAFGGDTLDELFITTARDGLSVSQLASEPHAGDLFWCRPGASGRQANRFAGEVP